jgi:hypothetical protein
MTKASPANPEFDKLMKVAGQIVHEKNWNASVVIALATSLAVEVNSLASLSGPQKKQLVLDVVAAKIDEAVKASIDLSGSPVLESALLAYLVENALPVFLDTLIAVSRGKIDLKKVVPKSWVSCFSCVSASAVQVASVPVPVAVPVLSSQPPAVVESKVDEIPLQSNPLYNKPEPGSVVADVVVDVSEEKEKEKEKETVDTEIPQQQNTDTVIEVPSAVEVSPATPLEKL